jgi:hypothetical protein
MRWSSYTTRGDVTSSCHHHRVSSVDAQASARPIELPPPSSLDRRAQASARPIELPPPSSLERRAQASARPIELPPPSSLERRRPSVGPADRVATTIESRPSSPSVSPKPTASRSTCHHHRSRPSSPSVSTTWAVDHELAQLMGRTRTKGSRTGTIDEKKIVDFAGRPQGDTLATLAFSESCSSWPHRHTALFHAAFVPRRDSAAEPARSADQQVLEGGPSDGVLRAEEFAHRESNRGRAPSHTLRP